MIIWAQNSTLKPKAATMLTTLTAFKSIIKSGNKFNIDNINIKCNIKEKTNITIIKAAFIFDENWTAKNITAKAIKRFWTDILLINKYLL